MAVVVTMISSPSKKDSFHGAVHLGVAADQQPKSVGEAALRDDDTNISGIDMSRSAMSMSKLSL